jgi:hypothetical protein
VAAENGNSLFVHENVVTAVAAAVVVMIWLWSLEECSCCGFLAHTKSSVYEILRLRFSARSAVEMVLLLVVAVILATSLRNGFKV